MLRIVYANGYREEITASMSDAISIHSYGPDGHELFSLKARWAGASKQLKAVADQIRTHGSTVKPETGGGEARFEAIPQAGGPAPAVVAADVGGFTALRAALLELDKGGRLAPATMRHWLEAAESRQALHQLETAFQCGVAALERGHLPHIRLLLKDDTSNKRRAAGETFVDGNHAEAVAMILRLARNYLKLIEDAWK